jgi:hypothetical protein
MQDRVREKKSLMIILSCCFITFIFSRRRFGNSKFKPTEKATRRTTYFRYAVGKLDTSETSIGTITSNDLIIVLTVEDARATVAKTLHINGFVRKVDWAWAATVLRHWDGASTQPDIRRIREDR